jgi:MFS family permease
LDLWLLALCVSRVFLYAVFMVVAAAIPVLVEDWGLTAAGAGSIVSAFTMSYAASLFVFAFAADRWGARNMAVISGWTSGLAALAFGLFARDYWSAVIAYGLAGAFQGGTYTPLIMVLADRTPTERRGTAMGWLIASTSIGYAGSIGLAGWGLALGGHEAAFLLTGALPLLGAALLHATLWTTPNLIHARPDGIGWIAAFRANPDARKLVVGYCSHTWELLGAWAWTPAFLAAAMTLRGAGVAEGAVLASSIVVVLHLSGAVSAWAGGKLSDRFGRRPVLVALSLAGGTISAGLGWLVGLPVEVLALIVVIHNVLLIGDSPVLSTAITERIEPGHLGAVLAVRALVGFAAGAAAATVVGLVLDGVRTTGAGEPAAWGLGFMTLAVGGLFAAWMASRLPRLRR